jgi:cyclopropane fatty-acyl-phospholipid synthase-like methyltransferase
MLQTTINFTTAPGHQVLAAAGKKSLRPGGLAATKRLFEWANFQSGETVLELASGLGESAIFLAKCYGVKVIGIEKNLDNVAKAQAKIKEMGLESQVQIIHGDIFDLDSISEQFDYVLAEAILSMQSAIAKAKILQTVYNRLKPGGCFLAHELIAIDEAELHRVLSAVIRVNATPLSRDNWIGVFNKANLHIQQVQIGAMRLLSLPQLLRDEGIVNTLRILWNLSRQPLLRSRVWVMRRVFQQYQQDLGYIILTAIKEHES